MYYLEPLESRIAPATLINPTTVTFQDVDGDNVTIKFSKPLLNDANAVNIEDILVFNTAGVTGNNDIPQQLQAIDLTNLLTPADANGVNITITAKRSGNGGDGFVNVGAVFADGIDLGTVTIKGDLGQVDAGSTVQAGAALKALNVRSMGEFATSTQALGGDLFSQMNGAIGTLNIGGNARGVEIRAVGPEGNIGKIIIGGSLIGVDDVQLSGRIASNGDMGSIIIKGSLVGADEPATGNIEAGGSIGSVNIGSIIGGSGSFSGRLSSNGDLGAVKITFDIRGSSGEQSGSIYVDDFLKSLTIGGSLIGGEGDYDTEDAEGQVYVQDDAGPIKIGGNIIGKGGLYSGSIYTKDNFTSVTVNGSLYGGAGARSGSLISNDGMGAVKILGSVVGGAGENSATIDSGEGIASLSIGGALRGGSGSVSGVVFGGTTGSIKVGNVEGGSGDFSGQLSIGDVKSITVAGSIIGGSGSASGSILAGNLASIQINGDIRGGSASGADDLTSSGYLQATNLGKVTIKGSLFAGEDSTTGVFGKNGGIFAIEAIGSITIKGGIFGKVGESGDVNYAFITAQGQAVHGTSTDVAIGSVTVGGSVEFAQILAGFDPNLIGVNTDAQIGKITVGGNWIASSISAGVDAADGFFGDFSDVPIDEFAATGEFDDADIFSKIGSIQIKGAVMGTPGGTDQYGFVAQEIGSVKIGAVSYPLISGRGNDFNGIPAGSTSDVHIRELPAVV